MLYRTWPRINTGLIIDKKGKKVNPCLTAVRFSSIIYMNVCSYIH
jgi:hypothetical protein